MKKRYWADYSSAELARLPRHELIAVLPVAAIEQHGPHLAMSVDTDLLQAIIDAAIPKLPGDLPALFLPLQQIGKSNEHTRYPGTLTFSATTLMALWSEIAACVVSAGVKKLVIFNSHGGQMNLMDVVTRDLRVQHNIMVIASNWYTLGLPPGMFSESELKHGIHAGDLETSMMLACQPAKVDMSQARNFESLTERLARDYKYLSITPSGKLGWQTQDLNPAGACGDASIATAEKGHQVIDYVSDRFIELLREVQRAPLSLLDNEPEWR
jgi:creatinine amidohydrolase